MLFNERLDTFSSVENKESEEQDRQSKINSLIMKYGRKKVAAEKKKSEERERKTGKKTTWSQFKYNLENAKAEKGKDPKGVRFYDKKGSGYIKDGKKKYDVEEGAAAIRRIGRQVPWAKISTLIGASGIVHKVTNNQGPGLRSGGFTKKDGVWDSLDKGLTSKTPKQVSKELKRKLNKEKLKKTIEDLYGPIPEHFNWMKDIIEDAPPGAKYERMVKHIKKSYKKDGKLTDEEKGIAYATAWKNYKNKTG